MCNCKGNKTALYFVPKIRFFCFYQTIKNAFFLIPNDLKCSPKIRTSVFLPNLFLCFGFGLVDFYAYQ